MTSPLNVQTLARHQPLYVTLRFQAGTCVFGKQSVDIVRCALTFLANAREALSRSYGRCIA